MFPPNETSSSSRGFEDRQAGLVIFGILTTFMGVLCGLLVPLMLFSQSITAKAGAPQSSRAIIPAIVIYGLMAIVLVWLGIGSIMAKRWARALLLIFSWSGLITGVLALAMMAVMFRHIMENVPSAAPAGQPQHPVSAGPVIVMGVILILIPAVWVFFYQSKHVKATCEAHDPVVRWTDRCPLPVIAISMWLSFSAAAMLAMAVTYRGVVPVFGMFVAGPLGSALYVLQAFFWIYAAWALYKLDRRGWWIVVIAISLFSISSFITYCRHDASELYSLMGYPKEKIARIEMFGFGKGQSMAWMTLICWAPLLGYLFCIRRLFFAQRAEVFRN
jgi:hypothetical protein